MESYPYTPLFQERILAVLVQDPSAYPRFQTVWNPLYFTDPTCQAVADTVVTYKTRNRSGPDEETLVNLAMVRFERSPELHRNNVTALIRRLYKDVVPDRETVLSMVVEWAKTQAMDNAVMAAAQELDKGRKQNIRKIIEEAYRVGEDLQNFGITVTKDFREPSKIIKEAQRATIRTGIADLDASIGGIAPGEQLVILGPPKGFKSGALLNLAMAACSALQGKNVTYVSLELNESKILERVAYWITKMGKAQLYEDAEKFDQVWAERAVSMLGGKLQIKNYPTRTMTATMLRAYLDLLDSKGHETQLLIVDYGNIMKAENDRASEWSSLGHNFESLRAIAIERNLANATAARLNRESLTSSDVRMEHIAGSMEIAATCDYAIAQMQTEQEHKEWVARHKILLSRNEDANILYGVRIDYDTFTITSTGLIERTEDSDDDSRESRRRERREARSDAKTSTPAPAAPGPKVNLQAIRAVRDILQKRSTAKTP